MSEFTSFLVANWHLSAMFVVILVAIIVSELQAGQSTNGLLPEAATELINRENALVFDCRDEASYKQGHVVGAIHLNLEKIEQQLKKHAKNKAKPLIVVDKDGRGFAQTVDTLKAQGFSQVFGLKGGIHAWREAGYPIAKEGE